MRLVEIEDSREVLLSKYRDKINFALDKFLLYNTAIYRGSFTYGGSNIIYTNPTTRPTLRRSAMNIGNYYTIWIDNNPKWQDYPKRSKSLICSTSLKTAKSYGDPIVVVPLINTKIGICPTVDIWKSFKLIYSLGDFSDWLKNIVFANITHDHANITYDQLVTILKNIDIRELHLSYCFTPEFKKSMLDVISGLDMFEKIFDPIKNGFTVTDWNDLTYISDQHEVWLSAPCLLIDPEIFINLAEDRKHAPK